MRDIHTVAWDPGAHLRAASAAVARSNGLGARERRLVAHSHPWAPREELSEAPAEPAEHTDVAQKAYSVFIKFSPFSLYYTDCIIFIVVH